jgi:RHS repeat-associated protein
VFYQLFYMLATNDTGNVGNPQRPTVGVAIYIIIIDASTIMGSAGGPPLRSGRPAGEKGEHGVATCHPFPHYEVTGSTVTKYYFFAGQRIAMKVGATLYFLHGDTVNSTSLVTSNSGAVHSSQTYCAYGRKRSGTTTFTCGSGNSLPTAPRGHPTFTGQKLDGSGLQYFNARYYDPQLGTFISPDTLVPDAGVVFDYNRYMYVRGNPLKYTDPTGHICSATNVLVPLMDPGECPGGPIGKLGKAAEGLAVSILLAAGTYGPQVASHVEHVYYSADAAARNTNAGQNAGNTADPGGLDPNNLGPKTSQEMMQALRREYENAVRSLSQQAEQMRTAGKSSEEIARTLHAARRTLGEQYKAMTPSDQLAQIYERNLQKYGDKLGPTIEWLRNQGKSWEEIIESASRPGGKDIVPKLLDQ